MSETSTRELHGVWAAQPIAWDDREQFDPAAYESDIAYLCSAGIHGIYSGGSTGEFYALDFDDFVATNTVMLRTAAAAGVPVQVGVTALGTREVERRSRWAADHGAAGVQVALPSWLRLGDDEVVDFLEDVGRAAGASYVVHYDTMRAKRTMSPEMIRKAKDVAPNFIGSKYLVGDVDSMRQVLELVSDFAIFTGEDGLWEATKAGARGTYSSLVMTNPALMLELYEACAAGNETVASTLTERFSRFVQEAILPLAPDDDKAGYWDSGLDRLQAMLNPNMRCGLRCQRPYASPTQADLDGVRSWIEDHDPELLL